MIFFLTLPLHLTLVSKSDADGSETSVCLEYWRASVKLVTIILYMYIVYINLIDKCGLMTFILYACNVSKAMIG